MGSKASYAGVLFGWPLLELDFKRTRLRAKDQGQGKHWRFINESWNSLNIKMKQSCSAKKPAISCQNLWNWLKGGPADSWHWFMQGYFPQFVASRMRSPAGPGELLDDPKWIVQKQRKVQISTDPKWTKEMERPVRRPVIKAQAQQRRQQRHDRPLFFFGKHI